MMALEDLSTGRFLEQLGTSLPRPLAALSASQPSHHRTPVALYVALDAGGDGAHATHLQGAVQMGGMTMGAFTFHHTP